MQNLLLKGMLLGMLGIIFICPYSMSVGICKLKYDHVKFSLKVKSMIPIYNTCLSEYNYNGGIGIVSISTILLFVGVIARFIMAFLVDRNSLITKISVVAIIVLFIFHIVSMVIFNFKIMLDANQRIGIALFLLCLIYPLGQYYIGAFLNNKIKHSVGRERNYLS